MLSNTQYLCENSWIKHLLMPLRIKNYFLGQGLYKSATNGYVERISFKVTCTWFPSWNDNNQLPARKWKLDDTLQKGQSDRWTDIQTMTIYWLSEHTRKHTKPSSNFKDFSPWSHIFSSIISIFIKNLSLLMLHPSKCFLLDLKQTILKCQFFFPFYVPELRFTIKNFTWFKTIAMDLISWCPFIPRQTIYCKGEDFLNACCIEVSGLQLVLTMNRLISCCAISVFFELPTMVSHQGRVSWCFLAYQEQRCLKAATAAVITSRLLHRAGLLIYIYV